MVASLRVSLSIARKINENNRYMFSMWQLQSRLEVRKDRIDVVKIPWKQRTCVIQSASVTINTFLTAKLIFILTKKVLASHYQSLFR